MGEEWRAKYSSLCKENFMDLDSALIGYNFSSRSGNTGLIKVREDFYDKGKPTISSLLSVLADLDLDITNWKLSAMICSACVCEGCTSCIEVDELSKTNSLTGEQIYQGMHCNGYTCKTCREQGYAGYDWDCSE